jgi:CRISPR-associated RAMP protein (TIGR02581 family)
MHKRLVNELRLDFLIAPQGPLLIKSGKEAGADPTLLDMNFVRTHHAELGRTVYLPGSSLKGVVRSYCEKIGRTVGLEVCNPLTDESCGRRLERDARTASGAEIYQDLCPICRLFGHTVMASHVWFADAYPTPETIRAVNDTEERDGVAIDRISGAVAVGPFQLEVVTRGVFQAQLTVRNFQLWQVGLLAVALRDMADGRMPIGFAKSRGLGQVEVTYQKLQISYPGQFGQASDLDFGTNLCGVTAFGIEEDYGFFPETPLPLPAPRRAEAEWGRVTLTFEDTDEIEVLLKATVQPWAQYVTQSAGG